MPSLVPFTLKPQILVRLSLLTIGSFLILIVRGQPSKPSQQDAQNNNAARIGQNHHYRKW